MRNARKREIEAEILNSEQLQRHFEENPRDLEVLRHDKVLSKTARGMTMKTVPDYLLPNSIIPKAEEKKKTKGKRGKGGKRSAKDRSEWEQRRRAPVGKAGRASSSADPLQSFKAPKRA